MTSLTLHNPCKSFSWFQLVIEIFHDLSISILTDRFLLSFLAEIKYLAFSVNSGRQCELAQAIVRRVLVERVSRPSVFYCGFVFQGKDAVQAVGQSVYECWDNNSTSPPKMRERDAIPEPQLQVLAWHQDYCHFPASLYHKFSPGTAAYSALKEMQADVEKMFPPLAHVPAPSQGQGGTRAAVVVPRASGRPDFSIEGGKTALDLNREIDLRPIPVADFNEPRPGE